MCHVNPTVAAAAARPPPQLQRSPSNATAAAAAMAAAATGCLPQLAFARTPAPVRATACVLAPELEHWLPVSCTSRLGIL